MENFCYRNLVPKDAEELEIAQVKSSILAKNFGTPLFVYDLELVERKYTALRKRLSKNVKIFYALKANSNLAVVEKLASLGCGADIASDGEFAVAKKAGFKDIIFSGPGKTNENIKKVGKIYSYHVESLNEAQRLEKIVPNQNIGLRVNASFEVKNGVIATSGGSQKFGIDEEKLPEVIKEIKKLRLKLSGLHCYSASGVLDANLLVQNAKKVIKLAEKIESECNFKFEYIDIGGGLGVPYNEKEQVFDLDLFCTFVNQLAKEREIWIELGRFLVAESGVLLTKVVEVKESRGQMIALVDGGINNMLRPAIIGEHPIVVASSISKSNGQSCNYSIAGPLCTTLDFLSKDCKLPELKEGDFLAILNAGAYGFSESMPFFLGHKIAGEVAIEKGEIKGIRKSLEPEKYMFGW